MEQQFLHPIVIEGAMVSEISRIVDALDDRRERELLHYPVYEGFIEGYPVVAARTMVGLTNAAILTTALCLEYSPLCVLSQGTAGAHSEALHTGDIILGLELRCMNSFFMKYEDARALEALAAGEWHELTTFESDPRLLELAETIPYRHGRIIPGLIGSANFWSHGEANIHALREKYGTSCEEMESFAAAWACHQTEVPYLAVRVLSNNELTGEAFNVAAGGYCQDFVLELVRHIALNRAV